MPRHGHPSFASLLAEQQELVTQVLNLYPAPREVLEAGAAVLRFAEREEQAFASVAPLLDPAVRQELAAEHRQFAEDLELLEWLIETTPDSPDVAVLTTSLIRRMRQHIERDGRLLSRAVDLARN